MELKDIIIVSVLIILAVSLIAFTIYDTKKQIKESESIIMPLHLFCAKDYPTNITERDDCIEKLEKRCLEIGGKLEYDKEFDFTSYCIFEDKEVLKK